MNLNLTNNLISRIHSRLPNRLTGPRAGGLRPLQAGFTLIELLIAMFLLVVISLSIYQSTTQTYRLREILMNEGDFYNGIRLSMGIMERDISLIYSPINLTTFDPQTPQDRNQNVSPEVQAIISSDLGRPSEFWTGAFDKTGIRPSRFVGTSNRMTFISRSHQRVYKESPESEFTKIVYELRDERALNQDNNSKVLFKIADTSAFEDQNKRDTYQRTYPLLHGIKNLSFRYYRKDKKSWLSSWDSDSNDDLRNKFPDIVEVKIEVAGPSRLHFDGLYYFRPEIPTYGLDPSS